MPIEPVKKEFRKEPLTESDWTLINRMLNERRIPNLRRLMQSTGNIEMIHTVAVNLGRFAEHARDEKGPKIGRSTIESNLRTLEAHRLALERHPLSSIQLNEALVRAIASHIALQEKLASISRRPRGRR